MEEETKQTQDANTEGTDSEEEIDLEWDEWDDEEGDIDPKDKIIKELEAKNAKLYQKLKSGYKKGADVKEQIKSNYVSKDELEKLLEETQTKRELESKFISSHEDAEDYLSEIKKVMNEDKISIEKAYALVKWRMLYDEGYKNQLLQSRTWNHGTMKKWGSDPYKHIFFGK